MFVCTHTVGSKWKQAFGAAPWWVKLVMDNGQCTFGKIMKRNHGLYVVHGFWPKTGNFDFGKQ